MFEIGGITYEECWSDVDTHVGIYKISSFGRLKRLGYYLKSGMWKPDRILLASTGRRGRNAGYLKATLRNRVRGIKPRIESIHRLVGFAFVPLVSGKTHINHKDGNKLNNHYTNLEWCTPQENNEHGVKMGLLKRGRNIKPYVRKGRAHVPRRYKKIIDITTNEIYESAEKLSAKIGITVKRIRRMLSGERLNKTQYRYVGMESVFKKPVDRKEYSPIGVFNAKWELVQRFEYKSEAAKFVGCMVTDINSFLAGKRSIVKGYKFKMVNYDDSFIEPIPFVHYVRPPKKIKPKNAATPPKEVVRYEISGEESQRFSSIGDAARSINEDKKAFRNALRRNKRGYYKGFIYKIVG